jgi:hypothetical protein
MTPGGWIDAERVVDHDRDAGLVAGADMVGDVGLERRSLPITGPWRRRGRLRRFLLFLLDVLRAGADTVVR